MSATAPDADRRDLALDVITAASIGVAVAAAFAVLWLEFGLVDLPFGTPAFYYLVGLALAVQGGRAALLDDRIRRTAALASVPGVVLTIVGLGPMGACAAAEPASCTTSLEPAPPILALGLLLTGGAVLLDLRRR